MQLIRTAKAFIGTGGLFRLIRLRKGPNIAALYRIGLLILQLLLVLGVGYGLYRMRPTIHPLLQIIAELPTIHWFFSTFCHHDDRMIAYYQMHDCAYSAESGGANLAELVPQFRIRPTHPSSDER